MLDATKIIPEEEIPVRIVGRLVLDRCVDNFFAETEQVAFHTGNIVPGIDFTQRSAAAGTQLLVPRHPAEAAWRSELHSFADQRAEDVRSTISSRTATWRSTIPRDAPTTSRTPGAARLGGPREDPENGFRSFPEEVEGQKLRRSLGDLRRSLQPGAPVLPVQTEIEQGHIASAFTFELSKVETPAIRARMVSHLLNVDEDLARTVADGLRLKPMPQAAGCRNADQGRSSPHPAAHILLNGPESFKGRKLGALVTDGVDIALLKALYSALEAEGALDRDCFAQW